MPLWNGKGELVRHLVARHDVIAFLVELVQPRSGDFLEKQGGRMHGETGWGDRARVPTGAQPVLVPLL